MFENENTNCNYDVTGINAQFGYQSMNNNTNGMMQSQMLDEIRNLAFAITDLAEYLNTHPTDEKALCLHKEYCMQYNNLTDQYQRIYGPLTIYCPCSKWRWLENPWPWEGSEE